MFFFVLSSFSAGAKINSQFFLPLPSGKKSNTICVLTNGCNHGLRILVFWLSLAQLGLHARALVNFYLPTETTAEQQSSKEFLLLLASY